MSQKATRLTEFKKKNIWVFHPRGILDPSFFSASYSVTILFSFFFVIFLVSSGAKWRGFTWKTRSNMWGPPDQTCQLGRKYHNLIPYSFQSLHIGGWLMGRKIKLVSICLCCGQMYKPWIHLQFLLRLVHLSRSQWNSIFRNRKILSTFGNYSSEKHGIHYSCPLSLENISRFYIFFPT